MEPLNYLLHINPVFFYIGGGYVLLLIFLYFIQDRFIFKPEKLPKDFTYKYDAPFKELFFEVKQGVSINGLHF